MRRAKWVLAMAVVVGLLGLWGTQGEPWGVWASEPAASGQAEAQPTDNSAPEQPSQPAEQAGKPISSEPAKQSAPAVSPEELEKLVQQLDADAFSDRQAASQRLAELGRAAIDALVRAATSESLEANLRALDILKKHLESQDQELSKSAKEALEKIAAGPRAPSARRARDILKAYEERVRQETFQQQGFNVPGARIQVMGQAQVIIGQGVRQMQIINNTKTIEGEDKEGKFRIVEDPKEGITVELTRTKDGKEVTEKFQAKNAEELQKKHPLAYEVYKRHSQPGGMIIQAAPPVLPPVPAAPQQPPRRNPVEMAVRLLQTSISQVDRLVTDEAIKDSSPQALEDLKKKAEEACQTLEKLQRRLQEAIEQKAKEDKSQQEQKPQEEKTQ